MTKRRKPTASFRVSLERLERRDLMAADLEVWRSSAFVASVLAESQVAEFFEVGAVLASSSSTAAAFKTGGTTGTSSASSSTQVDWYNANLHDVALRDLVIQNANDGALSRPEMLGVFQQVGLDGAVSAVEFADLQQVVGKTTFFAKTNYVRVLSIDVVMGSAANAHYQGTTLGNLAAGSSAAQLDKLVHKWFLGDDHPIAMAGTTYQTATGSLFPHAPIYTDVRQGMVGDCYFLASLAEAAIVKPSYISQMFIDNGDGTFTVKFNHAGKADYVTVDSQLPVDQWGNFVYANFGQNIANKTAPLWVALAEKAYVQMNEAGWLRTAINGGGQKRYDAISGGYMFEALNQITGKSAGYKNVEKSSFESAYSNKKLITYGSYGNPADASVVGGHAYAVLSYNKSKQQVTLFNPWGINNGYAPGLVTLTWTQMKKDFFAMQYA